MSLRTKKKQLIAAALAALLTVSSGVPAIVANAQVVFAAEGQAATYDAFTTQENADGTLTITGFSKPYTGNAFQVKVTFPATLGGKKVTKIGMYVMESLFPEGAYENHRKCPKVQVVIENGIQEIGAFAFRDDSFMEGELMSRSSLYTIQIPASVEKIGKLAFDYCPDLESIEVDRGNKNYASQDGVLYSKDMEQLIRYPAAKEDQTYHLMNSVKTIGARSFQGAENLRKIEFQASDLTTIDEQAFLDCYGLTEFELPYSVKTVDAKAFWNCINLTKIFVPYGVRTFEVDALRGTNSGNLATIYYEGTKEGWDTIASDSYLSDTEKDEFLKKIKVVTLDEEEYKERPGADKDDDDGSSWDPVSGILSKTEWDAEAKQAIITFEQIRLPADEDPTSFWIDSPSSIFCFALGADLFQDSGKDITAVSLPKNMRKIDPATFTKCPKLKVIYFAGTQAEWEKIMAASIAEEGVGRNTAEQLIVPAGVEVVYESPFAYRLEKNGTLTNLGCLLTNEELDETNVNGQGVVLAMEDEVGGRKVTAIDEGAFEGCTMTEVRFTPNTTITQIGKGAFAQCTKLTTIELPDTIRGLGADLFSGCYNLTKVTLPSGLAAIPDRIFRNCTSLSNLLLPSSIGSIGESAFAFCESLTDMDLPEDLFSIGEYAFDSCTSLESVRFSPSADLSMEKRIGEYAFKRCTNLNGLVLPQGLEEIKSGTFMDCEGLSKVWIPSSVKSIGMYAFFNSAPDKERGTLYLYQGSAADWAKIHLPEDMGVNADEAGEDAGKVYYLVPNMGILSANITAGRNSITVKNIPENISRLVLWRESDQNGKGWEEVSPDGTVTFDGLSSSTAYRISALSDDLEGEFGSVLVTTMKKKSSSSSSHRPTSSGSSTPSTTPTVTVQTNPGEATTGVTGAVSGVSGSAVVNDAQVQQAITKAQQTAQTNGTAAQGIAVSVPVTVNEKQETLSVTLPSGTLDKLVQAQVKSFEVTCGLISVKLDADMLKNFDTSIPNSNLILRVTKPNLIPDSAHTAIGNRPVYDVGLYRATTSGLVPVTNLTGMVTIKLPYQLGAGETADKIGAVYVDGAGNVQWLTQSRYDAAQKAVVLETDHLSIYGIGYDSNRGKASLTIDTKAYVMSPGNQYTIGTYLKDKDGKSLSGEQVQTLLRNGTLKVMDSRTGSIVDLTPLSNGNFQITGKNPGTAYILYEIGGTKMSVRIDVQNGVQQHGTAVRQTFYFQQ